MYYACKSTYALLIVFAYSWRLYQTFRHADVSTDDATRRMIVFVHVPLLEHLRNISSRYPKWLHMHIQLRH
jgi:hypothetical protein